MTREARITRIARTMRPIDPDLSPNILYLTAEFNEHDAEQRALIEQQAKEIERLKAQLTESEKAAYDVAGTIEQLQTQLATAKREVWDVVILKLRTGGLNILGLWEWCRQEATRGKKGAA